MAQIPDNSVGPVETQHFTFAELPNEMTLEAGGKLGPITVAYETYGSLSENKDNAILILHALSGDAHAAGLHTGQSGENPGWWDAMIGPGKAFDTNKYCVICSNILGGCKGTTGPASMDPKTGKPFATSFPMVTVKDMVDVQKKLVEHLGIKKLLSMSGGSLGGMQVLQWVISYPEMVESAIPIATTSRLSAQGIALDEVGRQAILSDPDWDHGNYYGKSIPEKGLAIARMLGHITYLSETTFNKKFGRRLQDKDGYSYDFLTEFEVESYLKYKGASFVQRFDANSYLYITRAIDYFDLGAGGRSLIEVFKAVRSRFLIISFSSDWLFPPHQSKEIVAALRTNGIPVTYCNIDSPYGHDAFLIESERQPRLVGKFLDNVYRSVKGER